MSPDWEEGRNLTGRPLAQLTPPLFDRPPLETPPRPSSTRVLPRDLPPPHSPESPVAGPSRPAPPLIPPRPRQALGGRLDPDAPLPAPKPAPLVATRDAPVRHRTRALFELFRKLIVIEEDPRILMVFVETVFDRAHGSLNASDIAVASENNERRIGAMRDRVQRRRDTHVYWRYRYGCRDLWLGGIWIGMESYVERTLHIDMWRGGPL